MTDIVERLYGLADDITPELAAQEITRLRAEIAVLRADLLKAEMKGEPDDIEEVGRLVAIGRREGIEASGPAPADTLFHAAARPAYDVALCMYHDQALIPIKTIDFAGGVNVTLGLPFVRTSPDHGTALDIAGTGRADPTSLLAAIDMADEMARRRRH